MNARSQGTAIVVATALPVEFQAVRQYLTNTAAEVGEHGTRYETGSFKNARIVVLETGAGNVEAAIEVETAISRYGARYLFFVGVAGGLKDVKIADVVAATKIYSYESGKSGEEFLARPKMSESSHYLVQLARSTARSELWVKKVAGEQPQPAALVGPVVAGEKVINSLEASELHTIRKSYSDAVALEMEGYGVLRVGYSREQVRMIVIRGISDLLGGKDVADAKGSQPRSSANAAAFTFEMIESLLSEPRPIRNENWETATKLCASLYPLGPTQGEIWSRAGGDLAALDLGQSGKANWHSALWRLRNGGGGQNITLTTLVASMIEDFPNNFELSELAAEVL
jgi:adenosylhomocysteine nucleosidase